MTRVHRMEKPETGYTGGWEGYSKSVKSTPKTVLTPYLTSVRLFVLCHWLLEGLPADTELYVLV